MNTVREVTYQVLRDLKMTLIFGNPGSTELPFLRDLPSDFRYVLALHERAAAGIALGNAMATRQAAFVNLHSMASAGNGLSAIVDANYCHAPLVITTGLQDRRHILAEPFLASRAAKVVRLLVKWADEPLRAEDVPAAYRARLLPCHAAAHGAGIHLHPNGRLEPQVPGRNGPESKQSRTAGYSAVR